MYGTTAGRSRFSLDSLGRLDLSMHSVTSDRVRNCFQLFQRGPKDVLFSLSSKELRLEASSFPSSDPIRLWLNA